MKHSTPHQYRLLRLGRDKQRKVMRCSLPGCVHKVDYELAVGRECLCYRCGNTFILNKRNMQNVKPNCDNCHIIKGSPEKKQRIDAIADVLQSFGVDLKD